MVCHRDDNAYWLDQLKPVEGYENEFFEQGMHASPSLSFAD
jgi:hypothetical protein